MADRGQYVAACLTITRAYLAAGMPGKLTPLASFEDWSDLVRSPLVWLGQADPTASVSELRASDPILTALRTTMEAWGKCFGQNAKTCAEVAGHVGFFNPESSDGQAAAALRGALMPIAGDRGQVDPAKLGYWLRSNKDRIVDGRRFVQVGTAHGGGKNWACRPVGEE